MAIVYRAEVAGGGQVAVKVLQDALADDPSQRERFEREARALFALEHPNILRVHDFGIVAGKPYLVMELLEGERLDALTERGPLDPVVAIDLAGQVLSGLAFAHGRGIVHRDLKTENVFVQRLPDGRWHARLLDFGLVKFADEQRWGSGKPLTAFGEIFGTPAYMSPEQCIGERLDARADVYSMGVVLFELLTGTWPFVEEDRLAMFQAHLSKTPPTLSETRTDVVFRPELEAVVARALAKRKEDRFADAGEMLAALRAVPSPPAVPRALGASAPRAPTPDRAAPPSPVTTAPAVSQRRTRPNRRIVWLAVGAVALLAVGVVAAAVTLLAMR